MNALDYLLREWADQPGGCVSYGGISGGTGSVQMTKQIVTGLRMMPMVEAVNIPMFTQYIDRHTHEFTPTEVQEKAAVAMLDELARWADGAGAAARAPGGTSRERERTRWTSSGGRVHRKVRLGECRAGDRPAQFLP